MSPLPPWILHVSPVSLTPDAIRNSSSLVLPRLGLQQAVQVVTKASFDVMVVDEFEKNLEYSRVNGDPIASPFATIDPSTSRIRTSIG